MPDTTRLTDAELDTMERRVNAATPGPWNVGCTRSQSHAAIYEVNCLPVALAWYGEQPSRTWDEYKQNAQFIAHSRQDMPRLIAELRAERAEVERLRLYVPELASKDGTIDNLRAENARLKTEAERLQRSILAFGNNPAGFDWGVLEKIDALESENALLRERIAKLEGKEST